jgi:large subunit ribosomal protein L5
MSYAPRLKTKYSEEVIPALKEKFGYKNVMEVPKLVKIAVNQGVGAATQDKKMVDVAVDEMSRITGQRAVATMSKKAVSNFKLREDMPIGARVTLRGNQMYEFPRQIDLRIAATCSRFQRRE